MAEDMLRLLGQDEDDVPVISALVQDMAVIASDAAYDARARRFVLLGNRYRWETKKRTRVRSALTIASALTAKRRAWPKEGVLELLSLRREGGALLLDFAGGASIRLEVEAVDLLLEDLTGPWGVKSMPRHDA